MCVAKKNITLRIKTEVIEDFQKNFPYISISGWIEYELESALKTGILLYNRQEIKDAKCES